MTRRAALLSSALGLAASSALVIVPMTNATPSAIECQPQFIGRPVPPGLAKKCPPSPGRITGSQTPTPATTTATTTSTSSSTTTTTSTAVAITRTVGPTTTSSTMIDPLNLPRMPWEGGSDYYARWQTTNAADWDEPSFFPVGVWYENVEHQWQIDTDKETGLNTYFWMVEDSNMQLIRDGGMSAITQKPLAGSGAETVAWAIEDEIDMRDGPGWSGWDGTDQWGHCVPRDSWCGYTVMQTKRDALPQDGRPMWANYGKGVVFWESEAEAAVFVNRFQEFVSSDAYWYTDNTICEGAEGPLLIAGTGPMDPYVGKPQLTFNECHRAWNYGEQIDRLRELDAVDGSLKPIYAFVEVGHPSPQGYTITGPQIKGAVMSSLIHGARGVIYFNHSFGGTCESQHLLRGECSGANVRSDVMTVNRQIAALAPVLNTQSLKHSVSAGVDTMLKWHDGSYYVFAMREAPTGGGTETFALPDGLDTDSIEVLYENRSIRASNGQFTDTFAAEHSYHIYKITP